MTTKPYSPTPANQPAGSTKLVLRLKVPGNLPSLNELLSAGVKKRIGIKHRIQDDFLSALRTTDGDSATRTTLSQNITLTAADTLDAYLQTRLLRRISRSTK